MASHGPRAPEAKVNEDAADALRAVAKSQTGADSEDEPELLSASESSEEDSDETDSESESEDDKASTTMLIDMSGEPACPQKHPVDHPGHTREPDECRASGAQPKRAAAPTPEASPKAAPNSKRQKKAAKRAAANTKKQRKDNFKDDDQTMSAANQEDAAHMLANLTKVQE